MSYSANFKKGDWRAQCDICGFDFHASQLKKQWDGLMVCRDDWNPRHPQDFVRGKKDDQSVAWTRSEPADTELSECKSGATAGEAVTGCAIAGVQSIDLTVPSGTFDMSL